PPKAAAKGGVARRLVHRFLHMHLSILVFLEEHGIVEHDGAFGLKTRGREQRLLRLQRRVERQYDQGARIIGGSGGHTLTIHQVDGRAQVASWRSEPSESPSESGPTHERHLTIHVSRNI